MGYYDGNTVTALWNYAQYFAMSDNSYGTNFGPSTDGALNLVSGQTNGVTQNENGTGAIIADGNGGYTLISDADPIGDACSTTSGRSTSDGRTEHRRPAQYGRRELGILRRRLRPHGHQP